jgi:hypothetical protein
MMTETVREKKVPRRKTNMNRDRLEIRAEPAWIVRVARAAERFGLSLSAFIRLAVTEKVEEIERNPPPETAPEQKKKGGK